MVEDMLLLARLQFAFTISFHIIFPAFTIGLASYLAMLEGLWLRTGRQAYRDLYGFWSRFCRVIGMGVVSGIVKSHQFGTNWACFRKDGNARPCSAMRADAEASFLASCCSVGKEWPHRLGHLHRGCRDRNVCILILAANS
jgi:hypothetical protein